VLTSQDRRHLAVGTADRDRLEPDRCPVPRIVTSMEPTLAAKASSPVSGARGTPGRLAPPAGHRPTQILN
jgi:hypothetical protein